MKINTLIVGCIVLIASFAFLSRQMERSQVPISLPQQSIFIQGIANSDILEKIIQKLSSDINQIIKEELGIKGDSNFFLPKERQRLSLYTLSDINTHLNKDLLYTAIEDFVKTRKNSLTLKNVTLKAEINLFGTHKDELVIMVNDPNKELYNLNQDLQIIMHQMNTLYREAYKVDFYNVTQSEIFSYTPHLGLGRIRMGSIQQHLKNSSDPSVILNRIVERIMQHSLAVIEEYLSKNHKADIAFNLVTLWNPQLREYLKEYIF